MRLVNRTLRVDQRFAKQTVMLHFRRFVDAVNMGLLNIALIVDIRICFDRRKLVSIALPICLLFLFVRLLLLLIEFFFDNVVNVRLSELGRVLVLALLLKLCLGQSSVLLLELDHLPGCLVVHAFVFSCAD